MREAENEDDSNPWELISRVPSQYHEQQQGDITTNGCPASSMSRKETNARGLEARNSKPWSTDPTLTRNGINRGSIILADGRPHTVGSLPRPAKVLSYQEAYEVSQSHSEARKIIKMQHKLINEDQHRMYEDWVLDKSDLARMKRDVKTWGTNGAGVTENPVVRAIKKTVAQGKGSGKKGKKSPVKTKRPHTVSGATGQKSKGEDGIQV